MQQIDRAVLQGWSRNDSSYNGMTLDPCANARKFSPSDELKQKESCNYLFASANLNDSQKGVILLVSSLVFLCLALILIVKILKSILQGMFLYVINL